MTKQPNWRNLCKILLQEFHKEFHDGDRYRIRPAAVSDIEHWLKVTESETPETESKSTWPEPYDPEVRPVTIDDADSKRFVQTFHEDVGAWAYQHWEDARKHKLPWYHTPLFFTEGSKQRVLRDLDEVMAILSSDNELSDGLRERLERVENFLLEQNNA